MCLAISPKQPRIVLANVRNIGGTAGDNSGGTRSDNLLGSATSTDAPELR
jgi:hypothetical protein